MNLMSLISRRASKVNAQGIAVQSLKESDAGDLHLVLHGRLGEKPRCLPAHMRKALESGRRSPALDNKLRM